CNKADIQYKTASNARLLVEVSLLQMCFGTHEAEKKKPERLANPPVPKAPAKVTAPPAPPAQAAPSVPEIKVGPPPQPDVPPAPSPANSGPRKRATLSIHGNVPQKTEEGPAAATIESKENFTPEQLASVWNGFVE